MTSVVRVLADYECYALWVTNAQGYFNVPPADFAISPELMDKLDQWSDEFDATLDREDPAASGFSSPEAKSRFVEAGRSIAQCLKDELGDSWTVRYFDLLVKSDIEVN